MNVLAKKNGHSRRILIVEDEALVRMALGDVLRDHGFLVVEAASAREASDILAAGTEIDLMFAEVPLASSIDAIALARRVRVDQPLVKIMVSSAIPEVIKVAALGDEVELIVKAYDLELVAERIRDVLSRPIVH